MEQSAKSLEAIEQTYNQKLALQAPVKYWKEVAERHRKIAGWFTVILVTCVGAFAWVTYAVLHWALQGVARMEAPQHWQLGVIVTTAILGIWTLRVLLRILISNVHLATDAEERKTMILTYLSLVREGVDVQPDDKTLILQHIFRSASDGIVKDDAAPPGIFELLTRGK